MYKRRVEFAEAKKAPKTLLRPASYAEFGYRKKIKDPDRFFKKIGKKNKTIKDPNKFFQMLGKKYT